MSHTPDDLMLRPQERPMLWAVIAFAASFLFACWIVVLDIDGHYQAQRAEAQSLTSAQAALLSQRLDAALSATYALGAVLRQNQFEIVPEEFESLAKELLRYHPGISSLQYAPNGITTYVIPLAGNEKAIGNNLLVRNDRNREALLAVETRQLTLAGPFELRQGGLGIAGRLPIYRQSAGSTDEFWGFAVALIRVPELIASARLDDLAKNGFHYTLWRSHPDTQEPQVFARSTEAALHDPLVVDFPVPNGRWHLSVAPKAGWINEKISGFLIEFTTALVFALLVALLAYVTQRQPALLRLKVAQRTRELDEEIRVRKAAETKLQLAAQVFESSAESIMITDAENRIVSVNQAFCRSTGYREDEVLGQTPKIVASGRHDPAYFKAMFEALKRDGHWQGEIWNRRKNGEIFPQWQGVSVVHDENGKISQYVSISSDISDRKANEEQIDFLSHYDPLTGLPNRILLRDRFHQALQVADVSNGKVAMLSLDLDRFKVVNDTLGHQMGDQLLISVVGRLRSVIRSSDTISRQGGDEFLILLQDEPGLPIATRVAQKIQEHLAEPFLIDDHEIRISSSIGISAYPDDGKDLESLLKHSDIAMYHAKESGRATFRFYTEELNRESGERLELEAALAHAIDRNELILHYQPQVDLGNERVVGAEALVRWQHPEKGLVSPAKFIPLAEETGLIVPLGEWVLAEACRQARAWQKQGLPPLVMSVNLSGLQFRRPGLPGRIADLLMQTGLRPEYLELELTESILVQDADQVLETVRELKTLGIKLAIDDFGTGYSSLSYLKRFDVDKLKIDQSFVQELCSNPEDAAIVRAIIQLGKGLGLDTIAEGVETAEQLQHLRDIGCDQVQGYFFSKPLPADQFVEFTLRRNRIRHEADAVSC